MLLEIFPDLSKHNDTPIRYQAREAILMLLSTGLRLTAAAWLRSYIRAINLRGIMGA